MKRGLPAMLGCCALATAAAVGQMRGEPQHHPPTAPKQHVHSVNPNRGQQVFNQNCSRCHNAPDGFSSRISGTIAMHMRARANLSAADYQALVRFLNP